MPGNQTPNTDEQSLWSQFIHGDDKSLEKLYRQYFDDLYNYGKKWLRDGPLTEDAIQDLFIKLMKNRSSLSETTSVKYYLFRSLRTVVLDKLKRENRMQLVDNPGDHLFLFELSPEKNLVDQQDAIQLKERLASAMQNLTPRQREAIFLRYVAGFSYNQVADAMELTAKGTYKLMARAIDALKDHLLTGSSLLLVKIFLEFG